MGYCKTGTGDAVSKGTEAFSEREKAAEGVEIVVQLRRGVEISSFTTFPLTLFPFQFVILVCWFSPFFVSPVFQFFLLSLP